MPDPSTVDGLTQSGTIIAWERQFGWRQRRVAKVSHSRGQRNLTTCQCRNQCWLRTRRVSPVLLQLPAILYSISLPLTLPLPSLCLSLSLSTRFLLLACCLCVALSLYLCVTRIRKKHHAPQSHQLRGNTSTPPPICSLSLRLILCSIPVLPFYPLPVPISSFRCLGVFQFDMLDRFSLI